MLAPTKHRFSVKEYYRKAETGVLEPDARVELLNGEIIDMSPIGPLHGGVTNYLNQIFSVASKGRWMTAIQNPLRLDDHSEPQPDLALLKPSPDFYRRRHPQPEDVYLLVEVSDASLRSEERRVGKSVDLGGRRIIRKKKLNDETIEIYREP